MTFTKISIYTTAEGLLPVSELLEEAGVDGYETIDAAEFLQFLHENRGKWEEVDEALYASAANAETTVICYVPKNAQGRARLARVTRGLRHMRMADAQRAWGRLALETSSVSEEVWANNWKQYFRPIPVGKRLLIKPSWEQVSDAGGRLVVEIDPGSSFGTGQHDTTRLCMELMEELLAPGDGFLDLGCGSGILTAAALSLGAGRTCSVDIEQSAVENARLNAAKHAGKGALSEFFCGDITRDNSLRGRIGKTKFELVAANIVADVILDMAPYFEEFLTPSGTLLISGIVEPRAREVLGALEKAGYALKKRAAANCWVAAALIRRTPA